jgi:hypothetical protein
VLPDGATRCFYFAPREFSAFTVTPASPLAAVAGRPPFAIITRPDMVSPTGAWRDCCSLANPSWSRPTLTADMLGPERNLRLRPLVAFDA